jgi:hypothetical protein
VCGGGYLSILPIRIMPHMEWFTKTIPFYSLLLLLSFHFLFAESE